MKRWISSALTTLLLLILVFSSAGGFRLRKNEEKVSGQEARTAVVKIVKRHRPKARPVEKASAKAAKKAEAQKLQSPAEKGSKIPRKENEEISESKEAEEPEEAKNLAEETDAKESEVTGGQAEPESAENWERKEKERSYKAYALSKIAGKKKYPLRARSRGQQGRVKMKIVIESDGSLSLADFVKKSEYEDLNEASLEAVKKSAPFKKMPFGMGRQEYVFAIDYSLE